MYIGKEMTEVSVGTFKDMKLQGFGVRRSSNTSNLQIIQQHEGIFEL